MIEKRKMIKKQKPIQAVAREITSDFNFKNFPLKPIKIESTVTKIPPMTAAELKAAYARYIEDRTTLCCMKIKLQTIRRFVNTFVKTRSSGKI